MLHSLRERKVRKWENKHWESEGSEVGKWRKWNLGDEKSDERLGGEGCLFGEVEGGDALGGQGGREKKCCKKCCIVNEESGGGTWYQTLSACLVSRRGRGSGARASLLWTPPPQQRGSNFGPLIWLTEGCNLPEIVRGCSRVRPPHQYHHHHHQFSPSSVLRHRFSDQILWRSDLRLSSSPPRTR